MSVFNFASLICFVALFSSARADDDSDNVGLAFALVAAAGLSTTFGAALVFFDCVFTQANKIILGAALGFAGGVMLYVSLVEIFHEGIDEFTSCKCLWNADDLEEDEEDGAAVFMGTIMFFLGVLIIYAMDYLVHYLFHRDGTAHHMSLSPQSALEHYQPNPNPEVAAKQEKLKSVVEEMPNMLDRDSRPVHVKVGSRVGSQAPGSRVASQVHSVHQPMAGMELGVQNNAEAAPLAPVENGEVAELDAEHKALQQMGILTAVAIALHNFPEGLATLVGTLDDPSVGASLAIAIAIHNIPEGICVAIPIYYATGSRTKGFWLAFWSGFCEIIGAALGYAFLESILGPAAYGVLFNVVAGMMVTITMKELIPTAHRYDPEDKLVTKSIFIGAGVMGLSLVLFAL